MKRNTSHRTGFTLIELLVVIAIIAILAAILFPVYARAKESGRQTRCLSNLKQIGSALTLYLDVHNGSFPLDTHSGPKHWIATLQPYNSSKLLYRCPSDASKNFDKPLPQHQLTGDLRKSSYGTNFYTAPYRPGEAQTATHGFTNISMFRSPSRTIWIVEIKRNEIIDHVHPAYWSTNPDTGIIEPEKEMALDAHIGGANYLFMDSGVRWLKFNKTWANDGSINLYDPK